MNCGEEIMYEIFSMVMDMLSESIRMWIIGVFYYMRRLYAGKR